MHAFEKKPIIHRNFISQLLCLQCSHISYMHIYNIFFSTLRPILNGTNAMDTI